MDELRGRVSQGLRRCRDSGGHIDDIQKVNLLRPFCYLPGQKADLRMLGRL